MGTGFVIARFLNMYPIDVAIVNACHSGQGGTGDVADLDGGEPDAAYAVRADRDADRWSDHRDRRADHLVASDLDED